MSKHRDILGNMAYTGMLAGVGCFFVPAAAGAAGGPLVVVGACALGGMITECFGIAKELSRNWERFDNDRDAALLGWMMAEAFTLTFIDALIGTLILAAAFQLAVAFQPLLLCAVLGTAASLVVPLVAVFLAPCVSGVADCCLDIAGDVVDGLGF